MPPTLKRTAPTSQGAAYLLATWFKLGTARLAPGTVGSLGAVPLHFLLCRLNPWLHGGAILGTALLGVWAAQVVAEAEHSEDPQQVVIDEVVGTLLAMGLVRSRGLATQLAALLLFRVFDIWKPGLVGKAEHAEPAGLGIMLDDVLAGILAGLIARRF
jgi:phosphatidylglycerophosphatase A